MNSVLAITSPDNEASGKLLKKLNFKFDKIINLPNESKTVKLFVSEMP